MLFCQNCGTKIVQGDKFCRECGNNLNIVRTENISAGPDEQCRGPLLSNIFISEPPKNNILSGPMMMKMGMTGMDMMGAGTMSSFTSGGRHFAYSTHGMAYNSGFDYSVDERDGKLYAKMRLPNLFNTNAREFEIPDELFDRITDVINRFNGDCWDGFSGHAEGVMDGESFSFSYNDGKGRKISAGGYMSWPEGLGSAINIIKGMMEEAYYVKFPDYAREFRKFFDEEVVAKYGESNRKILQGYYYSTAPYLSNGPGSMTLGENTLPAGLLDYLVFSDYCDMDNSIDDIKCRGIAVLVDKELYDDGTNATGIRIQYYGMDKPGEIKLYDEFKAIKEVVRGQSGTFRVFTYRAAYGPILGIWENLDWDYGNDNQYFYFYLYYINKDNLELIDSVEIKTSGEERELSDENLERLCAVAEKAGVLTWAEDFRKVQPRKYLKFPEISMNKIAGFTWYSHFCPDFKELAGKLPVGEQLGDSHITVVKL